MRVARVMQRIEKTVINDASQYCGTATCAAIKKYDALKEKKRLECHEQSEKYRRKALLYRIEGMWNKGENSKDNEMDSFHRSSFLLS